MGLKGVFYTVCKLQKPFSFIVTRTDGNVHKYFSPYKAPADAYVNFMNVLADFRIRLLAKVDQ